MDSNKRKDSTPKGEIKKDNPVSIKDTGNTSPIELIKEQYVQYYEMVRHHTSLSWNIPSFAVACAVLFFGLDTSKMQNWSSHPIFPAAYFFIICFFFFVMLVHHKRNEIFAGKFDKALFEIEMRWGIDTNHTVHHMHSEAEKGKQEKAGSKSIKRKENFFSKVSSTTCLSLFLYMLIFITLSMGLYFTCLTVKQQLNL